MSFLPLVASLLIVLISSSNASIGGYFGTSDLKRFSSLFTKTLSGTVEDESLIFYGTTGLRLVNEVVPDNLRKENCAFLQVGFKHDGSPESVYHSLTAWNILGCSGKLYNDETIKNLKTAVEGTQSSISAIRYAAEALKLVGQTIPTPNKVAQLVQTKLKEDDSLQSLGHALHLGSLLGSSGKFALDRVEDVVVQADEIDGKLLQWEGGLTTTSLLVTGLLNLNGAKPFTPTQADKIANYLLTRKTVQTAKGAVALLEAVKSLAASSVSPVSISIIGKPIVTVDKPDLRIQISDLLGQPLKSVPSPVVAQSATRINDDVVVLSKQPLTAGSGKTEFVLPLRLDPSQYRVVLTVGSHTATLVVRVLGPVTLSSFEIGVSDADGSSAPRLTKLQHPSKLPSVLQADASQHLVAKFALSRAVHQAFLRLHSENNEIVFIAEQDSSKQYKVDVNLPQQLTHSGTFSIELILGDASVTNPLRWTVGTIDVNLGTKAPEVKPTKGPKPEIRHLFRQAEKRPPQTVSLLFSALTATPLLVLLVLWFKIGINFGNFSLTAVPFHLGFLSILSLFLCFWLKLDMFQTCAWLIPLGIFTFLSGHKLLSNIARSKKEKPEKKQN